MCPWDKFADQSLWCLAVVWSYVVSSNIITAALALLYGNILRWDYRRGPWSIGAAHGRWSCRPLSNVSSPYTQHRHFS
jgi:hypothetical protein